MRTPTVICFGEMLWDILPTGRFPGGAPFNVAYHLHQMGVNGHIVSSVGLDPQGEELILQLKEWGIETEGIAGDDSLPTGSVQAQFGPDGRVAFKIATNVTWDRIPISENTRRVAASAQGLVFGSLAQRTQFNRLQLDRLMAVLPAGAVKFFDVNLRAPHDDLALVRDLAVRATMLKFNADEAARLIGQDAGKPGEEEANARMLAESCHCGSVCITAAERGAGWLHEGRWYWESGRQGRAFDPVGAGDAFVAALLASHFAGITPMESLVHACRVGEWVAGQPGATPSYQGSGIDPLVPEEPTHRKGRTAQAGGQRRSRRLPSEGALFL